MDPNPACNPDGTGVGTEYLTPINVPQPSLAGVEIRAIVCLEDRSSFIQTGLYRVTNGQLGMVTRSLETNPPAMPYETSPQFTTLSPPGTPAGATVHYTVDGTTPACSSPSTPNPVVMNASTTIRVIACAPDWTASPVATFPYIIQGTVDTPTFSIAGGTFNNAQSVGLSVITPGASIRYALTTDGSTPNCGSSTTLPNITADNAEADITVSVIACRNGFVSSSVVTGIYTKTGTLAPPTFTPPAGSYPVTQSVTLNQGAGNPPTTEIRYRTDGTPASCSDTVYDGTPIVLTLSQTITAISCRTVPFWNPSTSVSAGYTITGTLATPNFTPGGGTYNDTQSVTINSNAGSTIYYNLAVGSTPGDPSCGSGLTTQPIAITQTDTRIRAIACLAGWTDSPIGEAIYTLRPDVPVPDIPAGTYGSERTITFTSATPGTTIRINIGATPPTTPTCADAIQPSITIPSGSGLRFLSVIACRADFTPSLPFTPVYTINSPVTAPTVTPTLDIANRVTVTPNTPPAMQNLCYQIGTDPECSDTVGGTPNPIGGFCATGSLPYNAGSKPVITVTSDFRVRACSKDHQQSPVVQQTFTISGTVGAVSASPPSGTVNSPPTITLTAVDSTQIYYRIDGMNPDSTGVGAIPYSGPFLQPPVNPGVANIKAIGCAAGRTPSAVADFTYNYVVATPVTASTTGTKTNDESVTITIPTTPAPTTIRYRLDGINPDCSTGTEYTGPISLPTAAGSPNVQLRVIGCKADYDSITFLSRDFTFQPDAPVVRNHITNDIIGGVDTTSPPITVRFETTTTGGKVCLGVSPTVDPSPTCNGTTGNCGVGTIDLGLNSGTYFFNSTAPLRTSAAICKANYLTNSSFTIRRFLVLGTPIYRTFVSAANYTGNLGGPIGADDKCNADTARPSPNVPYLAFLAAGPTRNLGVGNPFLPSTTYFRANGTTQVLLTDATGNPPLTLANPFTGDLLFPWTGFDPALSVSSTNCLNWTSIDSGENGMRGSAQIFSNWFSNGGGIGCNTTNRLFCIESRYRIWLTANSTNGAFGGLAGGDTRCNDVTDANHPKSGRYKAMLVLGTRVPGGADWVFKPNASYYRADRTTLIAMTDSLGRFIRTDFTVGVQNTIGIDVNRYWTGATASNFAASSTDNCSNFSNTAGFGVYAIDDGTAPFEYVNFGTLACTNTTPRLLCVEQ